MAETKSKFKLSKSLTLQIGLIYTFLAAINITFFSVLIFENQTDLIKDKFIIESNMLALKLSEEIENEITSRNFQIDPNVVKTILDSNSGNVNYMSIIERTPVEKKEGTVPDQQPPPTVLPKDYSIIYTFDKSTDQKSKIDEAFLKNISRLQNNDLTINRYIKEADTDDLKIKLLIPLKSKNDFTVKLLFNIKEKPEGVTKDARSIFVYTYIDLKTIEDLKNKLWLQIMTSLLWGVVFHSLFGFYVYRVIFIRVGLLKSASDQMGSGDLQTRVKWKFSREDELDDLGLSFNTMAATIEDNIHKIEEKSRKIEEDAAVIGRLNAEINQELEIGQEVQQLFLSKKVKYKQFKLAVSYRPMREVSGDIYHFYKFSDHKKSPRSYNAFFLADASGHGVSAALITVVMVLTLDAIVKDGYHPSRVINKLSEVMGNTLQSAFFATAVFFLINDKMDVYVANAGHNPPIVYTPSTGEMRFINSSGPPLGMAEDHHYRTERIKTKPGDKIFMYTDGLVESPNHAEEQFGEPRVIEIIKNNLETPNQELLEILANALEEFKMEYRDDVSMILLEIPE
jgi:phosphoserine phosphatase RsbU/P